MGKTVFIVKLILLACWMLSPVQLIAAPTPKETSTEGAAGTSAATAVLITTAPRDVTYAELISLRDASSFVPHQVYRITNFRTRWYSSELNKVFEGQIEPLLVQAVSSRQLSLRAYSEKYPYDEIDYIMYDGSLHGETKDGAQIPSNDRGGIVRRKDINRDIECGFDFRAYTVRLFETRPGSGIYRHYGQGPKFEDRPLFDFENSVHVSIGKASIPWLNEDGTTDFTKGFGNPEHYLEWCDKVRIGAASWRIRVYGKRVTNGTFGECTDDVTVEGEWNNSQMLGFNNVAEFGADVATSFFMGGVETLKVSGEVTRTTFLPGISGVTFNGPISDSLIFPHPFRNTGYTYNAGVTGKIVGAAPSALGALEDAPHDGHLYIRQNGKWVRLPQQRK